jgi:hypothetical protein
MKKNLQYQDDELTWKDYLLLLKEMEDAAN